MRAMLSWLCCALWAVCLCGCTLVVQGKPAKGAEMPDGTVYLGEVMMGIHGKPETLIVGKEHGTFSTLRFDSQSAPTQFELKSIAIEFGLLDQYAPPVGTKGNAGIWGRELKLPKGPRTIETIYFEGHPTVAGASTLIQIYGRR